MPTSRFQKRYEFGPYPKPRGGVAEALGADRDASGAGLDEVVCVLTGGDAAHADDRQRGGCRDLADLVHGDRPQRRARLAAPPGPAPWAGRWWGRAPCGPAC